MKKAINRTCPHFNCEDKKSCSEHRNGFCEGKANGNLMCGCDTCEHIHVGDNIKVCLLLEEIVAEIPKPICHTVNLNESHAETTYDYDLDYYEPDPIIYP